MSKSKNDRFRELMLKTVCRIYGLSKQNAGKMLSDRAAEKERRQKEEEEQERQRSKAAAEAKARFMARHQARMAMLQDGHAEG